VRPLKLAWFITVVPLSVNVARSITLQAIASIADHRGCVDVYCRGWRPRNARHSLIPAESATDPLLLKAFGSRAHMGRASLGARRRRASTTIDAQRAFRHDRSASVVLDQHAAKSWPTSREKVAGHVVKLWTDMRYIRKLLVKYQDTQKDSYANT